MTREDVIKELEEPCDCCSYDHERCHHPDFTIYRMADEIVRLRELASERDQFASMLHDCENERDGLKHIVETYGKVQLRHLMSNEVSATFTVSYEVLKAARDPELVFAVAIPDVMHQFREFMREQTEKEVNA